MISGVRSGSVIDNDNNDAGFDDCDNDQIDDYGVENGTTIGPLGNSSLRYSTLLINPLQCLRD